MWHHFWFFLVVVDLCEDDLVAWCDFALQVAHIVEVLRPYEVIHIVQLLLQEGQDLRHKLNLGVTILSLDNLSKNVNKN